MAAKESKSRSLGSIFLALAAMLALVPTASKISWKKPGPAPEPSPAEKPLSNFEMKDGWTPVGATDDPLLPFATPRENITKNGVTIAGLSRACEFSGELDILPIFLASGFGSVDIEKRMRNRVAVLEGLFRHGFYSTRAGKVGVGVVSGAGSDSIQFTFEAFQNNEQQKIICIWIPFTTPANSLLFLHALRLLPSRCPCVVMAINTDGLTSLLGEYLTNTEARLIENRNDLDWEKRDEAAVDTRVFIPRATAPFQYILGQINNKNSNELIEKISKPHDPEREYGDCFQIVYSGRALPQFGAAMRWNVQFERTICTDDRIVQSLVDELSRRRVLPKLEDAGETGGVKMDKNHILLIGEWDTRYGRNITKTMRDAMIARVIEQWAKESHRKSGAPAGAELESRVAKNIYELEFMQAFGSVKSPTEPRAGAGGKDGGEPVAAGASQEDYLRRAQYHLRRQQSGFLGDGRTYTAVGIFASSVYDKLLAIMAVREALPNAVLFTTDIDSELVNPAQFERNRNLLIGSTHSLALRDGLQGGTPPFRDCLQTSVYLTTLRSLKIIFADRSDCSLEVGKSRLVPHVYEVGRTGPFDLTAFDARGANAKVEAGPPILDTNPEGAPGSFTQKAREPVFAMGIGVVLLLLAAAFGSSRLKSFLISLQMNRTRFRPYILCFSVISLLPIIYYAVQSEEPFSLLEGISQWPGILIRWAACVLALFAFGSVWATLNVDLALLAPNTAFANEKGGGHFLLAVWGARICKEKDPETNRWVDSCPSLQYLWATYRERIRPKYLIYQTTVGVILVASAAWLLAVACGARPAAARGASAFFVEEAMGVASLLIISAIVVYTEYLIRIFSLVVASMERFLRDGTKKEFINKFGYELVRDIGRHSEVLLGFLNIPAICVMLSLVAKSGLFDQFEIQWEFAGLYCFLFALLVMRSIALWRISTQLKKNMLRALDTANLDERRTSDLIGGVESGVFASLMDLPILKPLLIVATGIGGIAMPDLLAAVTSLIS